MNSQIPLPLELEGKIIRLRTVEPSDAILQAKLYNDPKTMEYLKFLAGLTIEKMRKRIEEEIEKQKSQSGIYFSVFLKSSKEYVGVCGFNYINLTHKQGEFGVVLDPKVWGTGISAECNLLSFEYVIEILGLHRIEFTTSENNSRARKHLENLGIELEGIQKEKTFEEGKFLDQYTYVFFEAAWPEIKAKLEERLARQSG